MNGKGLMTDLRVLTLLLLVLAALVALYAYPTPPPGSGVNGNLKYGLDLVGGSWLQLKLEGVVVGIAAPINESEVVSFLEERFDAQVVYYTSGDVAVYEIRKSVSEEELTAALQEINGQIVKQPDGTDFYEEGVTDETRDETRRVIEVKLNLLGLADTTIRTVGTDFILVDIAGVDIGTAKSIVGKPGKFEIRIQTAGLGGEVAQGMRMEELENITAHVVYGSEGIEGKSVGAVPVRESEDRPWGASFTLTEQGAVALQSAAIQYGATDNPTDHEIAMLLDDVVIYSAPLSPELAKDLEEKPVYGLRAETGLETEGFDRAKTLIVHLKAGVLPVNVEIVGSGEVPAYMGAKFKEGAIVAGLFALLLVALVVFVRYMEWKIVLPMVLTLLSELILILGFAAWIHWQLDLPSIAGIIAVIGTGVDQLVIISDEVLSGGRSSERMYRKRISFAFGIILASALTTIVAMLALAVLALGTLRGFAIVTIVGLLIGILITRPAYARIIEEIV